MNNNETKTFTAEEVNKIIEDRLSRERKQNSSLSELKEFLKLLKEEGKLKGNSIAELVNEFMALATAKEVQEETVPEVSTEPAIPEEIISEETTTEVTSPKERQENPYLVKFENEAAELCANFPELNLNELISDEAFVSFYEDYSSKKETATLLEVYLAFEKAKEIERKLRLMTQLKRTPSSMSATDSEGAGLTPIQRAIANKSGMSYKEYAKLLAEIPKRKLSKSN